MLLEWWSYPLLFAVALVAGLVDAVAGGGGLITLPALLTVGFPPPLALGTNKLQSVFGSSMATWHYSRNGVIDWRACRFGIAMTFIGALAGAWTVQRIDAGILTWFIPWLLGAILIYTVVRPELGRDKHPARLAPGVFFVAAGLGLGFYDGFFGPGTGSFWTIALVLLLGQDFLAATGHTKVLNVTSNFASLLIFISADHVAWRVGGVMAVGQIAGARIGAGLVVKKGARFIRPVFLTMVALTIARLAYVALTRSH